MNRPRLVGINHVALEVDGIERAVAFYSQLFEFHRVDRQPGAAFIGIGDQFIALMQRGSPASELERHFGLVVDDKERARAALATAGAEILAGQRLDFRDLDGNRIQIVQYDQIQFTKADTVLRGMGLKLGKTEQALLELRAKNLA